MGKTYRRDRVDKQYKEGNPKNKHNLKFKCKCDYCTSQDKKRKVDKWYKEEIKSIIKK